MKDHTEYFYTSIETLISDEARYHEVLLENLSSTVVEKSINSTNEEKYSPARGLQASEYEKELRESVKQMSAKTDGDDFYTSIICMNVTEDRYYVYS